MKYLCTSPCEEHDNKPCAFYSSETYDEYDRSLCPIGNDIKTTKEEHAMNPNQDITREEFEELKSAVYQIADILVQARIRSISYKLLDSEEISKIAELPIIRRRKEQIRSELTGSSEMQNLRVRRGEIFTRLSEIESELTRYDYAEPLAIEMAQDLKSEFSDLNLELARISEHIQRLRTEKLPSGREDVSE